MEVIKRDGTSVDYDETKIMKAIQGANSEMTKEEDKLSVDGIANLIEDFNKITTPLHRIEVEEIQDIVEELLMRYKKYKLAKAYIIYRYIHAEKRSGNDVISRVKTLIDGINTELNEENSNKNSFINSVQRDYMAGEVSKEITKELLPEDIYRAWKEGLIHFHDSDYFAQYMTNCCLIALDDMLENSTVISDTLIETPHAFSTACTIATQIIAQVASSQYGGQSISLAHLAPYVDKSRQKFTEFITRVYGKMGEKEKELLDILMQYEISKGVQTIQYQVQTLLTTNGQAPFLTLFMWINEVPEGQTRDDLALLIEEVLKQRILGVKNEKGIYVSPAFPKLIYVTDENNIYPDRKYWYLTELACKCTAKRLVPDYISAKKMAEYKEGNVFPVMGCVEGNEIISYKYHGKLFVESFKRMWERLSEDFPIKHQFSEDNPNLYMDLTDVEIYDTEKGFVNTQRIIRNKSNDWVKVHMSNGRILLCTSVHPFDTVNRGRVLAKDLQTDIIRINHSQVTGDAQNNWNEDLAWAYGVLLCDSSYAGTPMGTFAINGEDDIIDHLVEVIENNYNIKCEVREQHRGVKGNYKEVVMPSRELRYDLCRFFEGIAKVDRHIPNILFSMKESVRLAFLAGMIDADGYINATSSLSKIQISSTNKELALQQMALIQSLGMPAYQYENHYSKKHADKIRYRIEAVPSDDIIDYLICNKKNSLFKNNERCRSVDSIKAKAAIKYIEVIDNYEDYSYDVTTESDHFEVSGIYSHNCRSNLSPWKDENGNYKFYGRFNQGVVTINLVDVACSSNKDMEKFWQIFDERLELCHRALLCRHERLKGTTTKVAPILWQYGAYARLGKDDVIDELLYNGYSTISLGYAGLAECVYYMTGKSHTSDEAKPFALSIMQHMNDMCNKWKEEHEHHLAFSLYGTPLESTTYSFAKALRKRFGVIEGVTDKDYITNSYHVKVTEQIDAFSKLAIEAEFQHLSTGGAISYIEVPNMQNNIEAIESVVQFMYENVMYAELNTKSDYCQVCGYDGEIQIVEDDNGKLIWECPNCKNRDQSKMNVARRSCGYIGTQFWNQGRTQEIKERVLHL